MPGSEMKQHKIVESDREANDINIITKVSISELNGIRNDIKMSQKSHEDSTQTPTKPRHQNVATIPI